MSQDTIAHPAFTLERRHPIASLNVELQQYRHRKTGARHYHLAAEDDNNVFLVAFMTVPQDSTGVAHILEHTALCGSERFPVRDPFFMMSRRSLNTFMNAFTSSDWTAYPFASQNKKDFNNLLDVYLDAAFFPLLHELDFAQEGHRVEFSDADDPDSDLVFKGVVFNEMKGAMSSPVRRLAQDLQTALFPTVTYHHNSGGEPSVIPELSHDQLKAFHARHYHPSNAVFMTYGNIPAAEHQQRFEDQALARFERLDVDFAVPDETPFATPQRVTSRYALDEDPADKTHIVVGWTLASIDDPRAVLEAHILSDVLLDNSSSPLRRALETSELGSAPSPLCGVDDDARQMTFAAGLEGSNPQHAEAVEKLILDVIGDVAERGVEQPVLESVLHQLELGQREITGDGYPYGLSLILEALTPALHGGDPAAALDQDALLVELRDDIKNPGFIKGLARRLLLDNPHRVTLTMEPDAGLNDRAARAEAERLASLKAGLSDAEKRRIVDRTAALEQRQTSVDDPEVLPRVTLADVPAELRIASGEPIDAAAAGVPAVFYAAGTNGIVYQQLVVDLPELDDELLDALPLYALCLTEVGVGERDYLQVQAEQAAVTGGLHAGYTARGGVDDADRVKGVFTLSGKALTRNRVELSTLMRDTFAEPRFDEYGRLRELVAQWRAGREQRVTGSGHMLALNAAGRGLSASLALSHRWDGVAGLKTLQTLDDRLRDGGDAAAAALAERLRAVGRALRDAPRRLLIVAEAEQRDALLDAARDSWSGGDAAERFTPFRFSADADAERPQGISTSTQVNFCAKAYPTVSPDHADAPALQVLGNFLRNGYLHRTLREKGGAYGGGAGYHGDSATFRFFSYRDPRFDDTYADFDQSLEWLQQGNHDERALEEAILGLVAAIDRPGSPAGEAITAFYADLFGRSPEFRRRFRQRVLDVTLDDLKRVATSYLQPQRGRLAAVSDAAELSRHEDWSTVAV